MTEHKVTVWPAQKADQAGMHYAACICGYRSRPKTLVEARKDGLLHMADASAT